MTLENLVARLEQGDERLLDQAAALIEGMTPVQECEADFVRVNVMTNAAAGRNDLARSPETDAASRTAYRMLDDARLRLAEGDVDGALVMFADVETRAHAAGLRQLEAHAIRLAVGQQMLRGATDGAASRLESALGLAIEAGDHGGAALCAVLMLQAQRASANAAVDPGLLLSLGRAWARRSTQPEVYETEVDLEAASIAVAAGGWRDALEILDECAARLAAAAIDHTIAYRIEMLRGDTLFEAGRLDEAAAVLTSLVDGLREGLGPRHVMVGDALLRLGATRRLQGDLQAARAHGLEAEAIYVERVGRDSPRAALVSAELAGVYEGLGEFTAARGALEQSIATNRRIRGADDAGAAIPLNQLAELEYEMGAHTEGLEHARAAVALARASFGPDHVYTAAFENTVGKLELATGQASAAVATLTRARTTLAADPQVNPAWSGEVAFFLAKATLAVDPRRGAEARALGREAEADLGRAQGDAPRRLLAQIATWRVAHGLDEANSSAR